MQKHCIGGCGVSFDEKELRCPTCHLPVSAQKVVKNAWQKATAVINTTNLDDWSEKRKEFNLFIASLIERT